MPENEVPQKLGFIGTGATTVWAAKHFIKRGKEIFILPRRKDPQFPELPSNSDFDINHAIATGQVTVIVPDEVYTVQSVQTGQYSFIAKDTIEIIAENISLYGATGLVRNGDKQLNQKWLDISEQQRVLSPSSFTLYEEHYGLYIAPKNNTIGSSLHSAIGLELEVMQRNQKKAPLRPYSYYFDYHKKLLQTIFKAQGLVPILSFFSTTGGKKSNPAHNPGTKEQALQLYMEIYEQEEYADLNQQHFENYNLPLAKQIFAKAMGVCYFQPNLQVIPFEKPFFRQEVKKHDK